MNLKTDCPINCNLKSYPLPKWLNIGNITKTLLLMKLLVVFLFATGLQVSARGYGQISLSVSDASLQKVFNKIQKQSGYNFFYAYDLVQDAGKVSVTVKDVSLEKAVEECLKGKALMFEIVEKTVVIKKKVSPTLFSNLEVVHSKIALTKVEGKVVNHKGAPMDGVSVVIAGSKKGTTTNANGFFSIDAQVGQTIEFSAIGFTKTSQKITAGNDVIIISLVPNVTDLSDIVIVGYGAQKKINLTGAVGSIKSEFMDDRPITSASQALSGAIAGVFVNQNSGVPGSDGATIKIRGVGTLNKTSPLVLIDGIESDMNNIDPNDIATITVLKDAASAAIYGSRASNGVILITTKRGNASKMPSITYSGYYGITKATNVPSVITNSAQYLELINTAAINAGSQPKYTQAQVDLYKARGPNTDWVKEIFKSAPMQQHNLTISGGSPNTSYLVSLGLLNQDAITPNSTFNRYNLRLNLDTKIAEKLAIGTNLALTRGIYNSPYGDIVGTGGDGGIPAQAISTAPLIPKLDSLGRLAGGSKVLPLGGGNPFAGILHNKTERITNHLLGSIFAEYEILKGLKVKGTLGLSYYTTDFSTFALSGDQYDWVTGEKLFPSPSINPLRGRYKSRYASNSVTSWVQSTYTKSFGNNKFDFLIGINQESFLENNFDAYRSNFAVNEVRVLGAGNASTAQNGEWASDWALRSYFGRINYNYNERYLLEMNLRRDGSSRFGSGNKYGTFPSVSAGWVISSEKFFSKAEKINLLKVRASWGQLGNQAASNNYPFAAQVSTTTNYIFNGAVVSGAAQTTYDNPKIKWETSTTANFGTDIKIFNKLNITADYFIRTTKDILFGIPAPQTAGGLANPIINSAKVQNKGFEFSADYSNKFGEVTFSIGANFTKVKSKLLHLVKSRSVVEDKVIYGYGGTIQSYVLQRGSALGSIFGYKVAGIFQSDDEIAKSPKQNGNLKAGDLKYIDLNGDNVIDSKDQTIIGQENPEWLYGGNIKLGYKGFELTAIVQGVSDFQSYGYYELYSPFFNGANLGSQWLDSWTPDNRDAKYPRLLVSSGGGPNDVPSEFWLQNRAFFRLKNVQLGYEIPSAVMSRFKLKKVRIYLNGQNLWTNTKFIGFDPERPDGGIRGGDGYPMLRIITFGLNATL